MPAGGRLTIQSEFADSISSLEYAVSLRGMEQLAEAN